MGYLGEVSLGGTITAPFATNDTGGSGADFTNATASVRACGTTASLAVAPITAGVNTYLLTHASFPPGCGEVEIAATEANGYTASQWYAVYLTATCDSEVPVGALGKFLVTSASKRTYDAAARVMDALNSDGAKISANQTVATASYVTAIAPSQTGVAIGTASNVGSVGTVLGTVNAEVVTKTGFSLAADQSSVTVGTASKVGLVALTTLTTTASNVGSVGTVLGTVTVGTNNDKTGYSLLADQSAVTVGTASNVGTVANLATSTSNILANILSVLDDTGTSGVVVAAASKTGYSLAADQSSVTVGTASNVGTVATVTNRVTANTDQIEGSDATTQIGVTVRDIDLSGVTVADTLGAYVKVINTSTSAITTNVSAILDDTGTSGVVVAAASKTGYSLSADQSTVTIGTASNVGALSAGERSSMSNTIHYYVPTGDEPAGSLAWTTGLQSMRLRDVETATAATTATRTLYKPDGTSSWGTYVVNTSASGASQITGASDS